MEIVKSPAHCAGSLDSVDWTGTMDHWNGILDYWNGILEYPLHVTPFTAAPTRYLAGHGTAKKDSQRLAKP